MGFGATYGFGPYKLKDIGDSFRPCADEFGNPFPGDVATMAPAVSPAARAPMQPHEQLSLNDAYLEYLKRLNGMQAASGKGMPAAPPAPAVDEFSGGLLGRPTALTGIDPRNPERLAASPQDDSLRGFYRDDPQQPWLLGR